MTWCEVGEALCHKAATDEGHGRSPDFMRAVARLFAGEVATKAYVNGTKIAQGCGEIMDDVAPLRSLISVRSRATSWPIWTKLPQTSCSSGLFNPVTL